MAAFEAVESLRREGVPLREEALGAALIAFMEDAAPAVRPDSRFRGGMRAKGTLRLGSPQRYWIFRG